MTQSSGNFQFPSIGIYKVELLLLFQKSSGDNQYSAAKINVTTNNSSYSMIATGYGFNKEANSGESYSSSYAQAIVDVSDTTNVKVQFGVVNQSAVSFLGDTNANKTTVTFTRLGDT
jgi:hypothetical protein